MTTSTGTPSSRSAAEPNSAMVSKPTFGERAFNGGANYARLLKDPNFLPALRNSLVFTVMVNGPSGRSIGL